MLLSQTRDTDLQRDAVVSDTLANHPDIVQAIEDVDWGKVEIHVDMPACFGKADLVILYPSLKDRDAIHNILTENPFF